MASHIVTYDLSAPNRDYDKIISAISVYDSVRLTESCWLIHTADTTTQARDYLKRAIDSNDKIAVIKLGDDWSTTRINKDATEWLTKYV